MITIKAALAILGIAAVVVIAVKFGKAILKLALVLAVVAGGGWLVLRNGTLNSAEGGTLNDVAAIAQALRPAPRPAPPSSAGGFTSGLCVGAGLVLLLLTLGIAGYFYVRWRLGARPGERQGEWVSGPNALWGRRAQVPSTPPSQPNDYPTYPTHTPHPPTPHPTTAYPAYSPYARPPQLVRYPNGGQPYPPVVVIRDQPTEPNEDPLDMLPLWDEGEW